METLWKGSKSIGYFHLNDLLKQPKLTHDALEAVAGAVTSGALKLTIGGKFPLSDATNALKRLADHSTIGKLLLQVG